MAILIGVVALAVLPNIGRSRESKDLQTLDNILASANVAIANQKVTEDGNFTIDKDGNYTPSTGVAKAVSDELGPVKLGSLDEATITVSWTVEGGASAALVKVSAKDKNNKDVCEYTDSSDADPDLQSGGKRKYCVKSKAS